MLLILAGCSCGGPVSHKTVAPSGDLADLVEAERSFALYAAAHGTREAFLKYLADDSIIFRPRPVNAREWYSEHTEDSGFLSWKPAYAEISYSGDFGYTTGPWEFRSDPGDAGPESVGHYVSVWKKGEDGEWRVVLDLGNVYDAPAPKTEGVETRTGSVPEGARYSNVDVDQEREVLLETDRLFSQEVEGAGLVAAYMSFSTDDVCYYRMGARPVKGKNKVRKALMDADTTVTWDPIAAGLSTAGDLGYTYGTIESALGGPEGAAGALSYLRIWRIEAGRRWSVALDIALPSGPLPREGE